MPNKTLTLTLVIPAFNEQHHLANCLEAVSRQTVMPDEVIVVDNNSSDKTAAIARSFSFAKVVSENRQGVVFARNKGFSLARGDLIARIDADTYLPPSWTEQVKLIYEAAGWPERYALSGPSVFRNRGRHLWYALHRLTYFWPSRLMLGHHTLVGSNMFITRRMWEEVAATTCLRTDMHEDMDLAHHVVEAGGKVIFEPGLKANIVARKMFRRTLSYPLMMLMVILTGSHLPAPLEQSVNNDIA